MWDKQVEPYTIEVLLGGLAHTISGVLHEDVLLPPVYNNLQACNQDSLRCGYIS